VLKLSGADLANAKFNGQAADGRQLQMCCEVTKRTECHGEQQSVRMMDLLTTSTIDAEWCHRRNFALASFWSLAKEVPPMRMRNR
jgi:hypothetical protein